MPSSIILTTQSHQDKNEIILGSSSASSSLREMMMVCTSKQEQGPRRRSEKSNLLPVVPPFPCQSSVVDTCENSCCYRSSDNTNCSSPSLYADDSSCNDHTETETSLHCTDICSSTPQNVKSRGVSISNLMQELQVNEQTYGYMSLEVASTYNAIGLFHCRLYKDYNGALHYHNKALHIIETLQQHLNSVLTSDHSDVARDTFHSTTIITRRRNDLHTRLIPLLVSTYMDIGTCYELQQNFNMAIQFYEKTDDTIIRLEQQCYNSANGKTKTIIPKHITFACRRAIARIKRL